MELLRVALFGHRIVELPSAVERTLEKVIIDVIEQNGVVDFYIGRNGDFDILATSVLHKLCKSQYSANATLNLVLPYLTKEYENNAESFLDFYTDVEVFFDWRTHPKGAIGKRNREMVDNADLIICYITHDSGGAWDAVQYAKRRGIFIINIAEVICGENAIDEKNKQEDEESEGLFLPNDILTYNY